MADPRARSWLPTARLVALHALLVCSSILSSGTRPAAAAAAAAADNTQKRHIGWTYTGAAGPDNWQQIGFSNCDGQKQSPINVVTNRVVLTRFRPLQFQWFDERPLALNLSNNHHTATASMRWQRGRVPRLSGGGLPDQYEVVNFHFHWGKDDFKGSEHTFDGESYPLEMHIVCKNTRYAEVSEALQHADGLAVLGVMFETRELDGVALQPLESALRNITEGGATASPRRPPPLTTMMPQDVSRFYRYEGSLTTPGCHEAVTWTVFLEPVPVTEEQLELFRTLRKNPEPIGFNFRPPQRRYGREVYLNTDQDVLRERITVQAAGQPGSIGGSSSGALRWAAPSLPLLTAPLLLKTLLL